MAGSRAWTYNDHLVPLYFGKYVYSMEISSTVFSVSFFEDSLCFELSDLACWIPFSLGTFWTAFSNAALGLAVTGGLEVLF